MNCEDIYLPFCASKKYLECMFLDHWYSYPLTKNRRVLFLEKLDSFVLFEDAISLPQVSGSNGLFGGRLESKGAYAVSLHVTILDSENL